jgi:hypothetical protein
VTSTQILAVVLYSLATVFAIWGPGISAVRAVRRYKASKDARVGTWDDPALDADHVRATTFADAAWGWAEFGFVALGVVLGSVASIILVVAT